MGPPAKFAREAAASRHAIAGRPKVVRDDFMLTVEASRFCINHGMSAEGGGGPGASRATYSVDDQVHVPAAAPASIARAGIYRRDYRDPAAGGGAAPPCRAVASSVSSALCAST